MKAPADITYTEKMLHEAMEMLEGLKHHMGMFQNQYYGKLKNRVKQHDALNKNLRVGLNDIDIAENDMGEKTMLRIRKQATKRDVLGFRLPMLTHEEPTLDITDITIIDPDNTFFMRMGSEAMTGYQIGQDHVLVIDRTLTPVTGSIVVFFHEGYFYTREYCPQTDKLLLKANTPAESISIEPTQSWTCFGVVMLTLNPVLQPQHRIGRYSLVCAC